jgi:hypothetical protein
MKVGVWAHLAGRGRGEEHDVVGCFLYIKFALVQLSVFVILFLPFFFFFF